MDNQAKILLTSDIHIGSGGNGSLIPEKIRIKTFKRIIKLAEDHDIMLIGGDLFDGISVDHKILHIVQSEFSRLRDTGTEIYLTPGMRELNDQGVPCPFLLDLNLTHVFTDPDAREPQLVEKNGHRIHIYGIPAGSHRNLRGIERSADQGFHLGLFYAGFNITSGNGSGEALDIFSFNRDDLKSLKLDFYALGSNHNFKLFKTNSQIIGAYPGSPEAASLDEKGDRYVLSISVQDNSLNQVKRLTVNSMQISETIVDCESCDSTNSLLRSIKTETPQATIQHLVLTGYRNFILEDDTIDEFGKKFYSFTVIDNSRQTIESMIDQYQSEDSVRGEFFRLLKESLDRKMQSGELEPEQLVYLLNSFINGSTTMEELLFVT